MSIQAESEALIDYVEKYIQTAKVATDNGMAIEPIVQLRGQAIELAINGFLATAGTYERGHDLVILLELATQKGLTLSSIERDHVLNMNQYYFNNDQMDWKYPSRFPTPKGSVWTNSGQHQIEGVLTTVTDQTRARSKLLPPGS